ncbi:MAG: hypothetical protein R3F55_24045 [Alphaproteobacteria bacterium]
MDRRLHLGPFAVALIAAAEPLGDLFGLPAALLRWAGVAVPPFVALVGWAASRPAVPRQLAVAIVAANAGWVVASIALLVGGWVAPTALGWAFVIAQAVLVGVYAELQLIGLRRRSVAA